MPQAIQSIALLSSTVNIEFKCGQPFCMLQMHKLFAWIKVRLILKWTSPQVTKYSSLYFSASQAARCLHAASVSLATRPSTEQTSGVNGCLLSMHSCTYLSFIDFFGIQGLSLGFVPCRKGIWYQ